MKERVLLSLRFALVPFLLSRSRVRPGAGAPGHPVECQVPGKPDSTYTLAQLQALSQRTVKARGRQGEEHSYTGVNLGDLLAAAGVPRGMDLKGKYLHNYVLATAADKYSVVFALPELDPGYTDKTVLVVWQQDGKPLPADRGPLAIVAPEDKHPARWVRQLLRIAVKEAG